MAKPTNATRLLTVRETLGLSQREFAEELGVAHSALGHWESGHRELPGPIVRLVSLYEEHLRLRPGPDAATGAPRAPRLLERSWAARTASMAYAGAVWALLRKKTPRSGTTSLEHRVREASAAHFVRTLGELKGLGMKLGQMFANADALDPAHQQDGTTAFPTASLRATPMSPSEVLTIFLEDFGRPPRELFAQWSSQPFFAASIGQVHRATLRTGESVAVKVQYPRIVEILRNDFRSIELLDRLYRVLSPGQSGVFYKERSARILDECDYVLEAKNARTFEQCFADRDDIHVPKVYDQCSSGRVLTTEFVTGHSIEAFAARADQVARNRAGKAIWDFFYIPTDQHGLFHADPHPGNMIVRDDGTVSFIDHGRVARMSTTFVETWRELIRAVCEKNRRRALDLFVHLDFMPNSGTIDNDDVYRLIVVNLVPMLWDGPFSFTSEFARLTWQMLLSARARAKLNVPRDAALWDQLIFGVFALLVPLRCSVDCRETALRHLYRPDERRPAPYTRADLANLDLVW